MWTWTLNWNEIRPDLLIGSCPMGPPDLDVIRRETAASAVLSLQHADCHRLFAIDYQRHARHGHDAGMVMEHRPMRDFDSADQQRCLPAAAGALGRLLAAGHRVYVHCTAGINRAPLTVLGCLTLIEHEALEDALAMICRARPAAAPDLDAWHGCRADLARRHRDATRREALHRYRRRSDAASTANPHAGAEDDWLAAEREVIRRTLLAANEPGTAAAG